jgi:hypothetical protein
MVVDVTVVNNLTTLLWAAAGTAIAASLSVIGKVIADICSRVSGRRAERRAIAATIAGEIGGYLLNLNSEITAKAYRALADLDQPNRILKLAAFPPLPSGHPAYDKLADKIGLLPPSLIIEISKIYNVVTGMRLIINHFRTREFLAADDDYQRGLIQQVAIIMETHVPAAGAVVKDLKAIALRGPFGCRIRHCEEQ